jgi:anaerobic dimethyl sulfoxide reductase subunit B
MAYAFHFDAASCSGCKACVAACADRHDLPAGLQWRRVFEVGGGGWTQRGAAWVNDVVAYSVSSACSHCERAICAEVCPTGALSRRADGLVLLDAQRCVGCRLCEWACPYGAPRYNAVSGCMTKCSGCAADVAAGRLPACVAACGLRALDFGEAAALQARHAGSVRAVPPMPDPSLTRPSLLLTPHASLQAGAVDARDAAAPARASGVGAGIGNDSDPDVRAARTGALPSLRVLNAEELGAGFGASGLDESALVAFTLLVQAAAGAFLGLAVLDLAGAAAGDRFGPSYAIVAATAALAMALSLLHLGRPRNAWRAMANVRASWLSREILFVTLFTAGSAAAALTAPGSGSGLPKQALLAGTAACGAGALYSMVRVYRMRTVPAWDRMATVLGFVQATGALGLLLALLLVTVHADPGTWATAAWGRMSVPGGPGWLAAGAAACLVPVLLQDALHRRRGREPEGSGEPVAAAFAILLAFTAASATVVDGAGSLLAAAALAAAAAAMVPARVRFFRGYARTGM